MAVSPNARPLAATAARKEYEMNDFMADVLDFERDEVDFFRVFGCDVLVNYPSHWMKASLRNTFELKKAEEVPNGQGKSRMISNDFSVLPKTHRHG